MMNKPSIQNFSQKGDLIGYLKNSIVKNLIESIQTHGQATLLVSGGSTPKPLFEALSLEDIAWNKVTISLCDERIVPLSDPNSNANLVKAYLLQNYASKANFVPLYNESDDKNLALEYANKLIDSFKTIDILILGMGEDAHTASLFPNNEKLKDGFDLNYSDSCITLKPTTVLYDRISITLKTILQAQNIYLHFEGENKKMVFQKALDSKDIFTYPIASVFQNRTQNIQVCTL